MRILVAPQELKGTLTASEAARAIARGLKAGDPSLELDVAPIADGGPGTLEVLVAAREGTVQRVEVTGPLGRYHPARWALLGEGATGEAVVEVAEASGLSLLAPEERDALHATSYGTGELLRAALASDGRRILVGLGGSASVDGGVGLAAALGVRFLRADGGPVPLNGFGLRQLHRIDASALHHRAREVEWLGLCDVQTPLLGGEGAAYLFGPQKGASPQACDQLEAGLRHLAAVARRDLGANPADEPGAGSAGGLGFGLCAFLGARLIPGFPLVADALALEERIARVDVVVTAEGRLDRQTGHGKGPARLARLARAAGKRVVILAGQVAPDAPRGLFDHVLEAAGTPATAEQAAKLLTRAARALPRQLHGSLL